MTWMKYDIFLCVVVFISSASFLKTKKLRHLKPSHVMRFLKYLDKPTCQKPPAFCFVLGESPSLYAIFYRCTLFTKPFYAKIRRGFPIRAEGHVESNGRNDYERPKM